MLYSPPVKASRFLLSDRIEKLVPAGHHSHGRYAQRIKRDNLESASVEQADIRLLAAYEGREIASHQARHRDASAIVTHRKQRLVVEAADMRHRIQRHADQTRPFERERQVGEI